ncbi:MAG: hypothetical protein ABI912_10050 [Actinomycetota bacterium]
MPTRLPDDRTTGQIGGKVAEVLWTHYASQGLTGTPLTPSAAQIATSPSYDDAYADTLFELAPPVVVAAPQPTFTPVLHRLGAPVVAPVRFQVFERLRPLPPAAAVVTSVVTTTASVQLVHDEPAPMPVEPEAEAAAVTVPPVPEKRFHVVQLGFLDGSTMDLAGDHPASKALRAAAAALTLRE